MQNLPDCGPLAQPEDHKDALHYLYNSTYGGFDWELTLDYMTRRYIQPLRREFDLETMHFADCAAGFGWLSFAYLRAGGKHATLVEPDALRLDAARAIAARLGLSSRCTFISSTLESAPLESKSIDIFASVETLEHVGQTNIAACVATIVRCARHGIFITTPNALFPVVAHDTRLPFAHWLPKPLRRRYAAWFNRLEQEEGNDFLAPSDFALLKVFQACRSVSNFFKLPGVPCVLSALPALWTYGKSKSAPATDIATPFCTASWNIVGNPCVPRFSQSE